jgi:hypothetical protein
VVEKQASNTEIVREVMLKSPYLVYRRYPKRQFVSDLVFVKGYQKALTSNKEEERKEAPKPLSVLCVSTGFS